MASWGTPAPSLIPNWRLAARGSVGLVFPSFVVVCPGTDHPPSAGTADGRCPFFPLTPQGGEAGKEETFTRERACSEALLEGEDFHRPEGVGRHRRGHRRAVEQPHDEVALGRPERLGHRVRSEEHTSELQSP